MLAYFSAEIHLYFREMERNPILMPMLVLIILYYINQNDDFWMFMSQILHGVRSKDIKIALRFKDLLISATLVISSCYWIREMRREGWWELESNNKDLKIGNLTTEEWKFTIFTGAGLFGVAGSIDLLKRGLSGKELRTLVINLFVQVVVLTIAGNK